MVELYAYNETAYKAFCKLLAITGKAAMVHPTGTGKSFIAFRLCEIHVDDRVCWLSPSEQIWKTQLENVTKASGFVLENVRFIIISYYKLMLMKTEERARLRPDMIILDEVHRCDAEEWGKGITKLLEQFPKAMLLRLTATHIRYLDRCRDMANKLFDGCNAHQMTLGEANVQGILPAHKYILSVHAYQKEPKRYTRQISSARGASCIQAGQILEKLRCSLEAADGVSQVFEKHLPNRQSKYLVSCANYAQLQTLRQGVDAWFGSIDKNAHIYEMYAETKQIFLRFQRDESAHVKLLYCIDMFNEGVHVDGLDGVVLCRTTVSPIISKRQIGRALSASGNRTPVIFDLVNNAESLYTISVIRHEMGERVSCYENEHKDNQGGQRQFEIIDEVQECRKRFAKLEEALSVPWETMYAEAALYYQMHGNLDVSKRYRTPSGEVLGNWIQAQRRVRQGTCGGIFTPERIEKLEAIGMTWQSQQEKSWEAGYLHGKACREKNGHLDVPLRFVYLDGFQLGERISHKRAACSGLVSRRGLNDGQIEQLNALGMIWNRIDYIFERGCVAAARFAAERGHLRVPVGYVDQEEFKLGGWVSDQRAWREELTPQQQDRLEGLGIIWAGNRTQQWEHLFQLARQYQKAHDDLDIPVSYETNGVRLGCWLERQKKQYVEGTLQPDRKRRLLELGMTVSPRNNWQIWYQAAKSYFSEHGTLRVAVSHATAKEKELYTWLKAQRASYAQGKLEKGQIADLERLGLIWKSPAWFAWKARFAQLVACCDPVKGKPVTQESALRNWFRRQTAMARRGNLKPWQQKLWETLPAEGDVWERYYGQARAYFQGHGHLCVNSGALWQWLQEQRRAYWGEGESRLSEKQILRLEAVDMEWLTPYERCWQVGYEAAKQYFSSHGRLDINTGYVTEQGYPLGSWPYEQKRRYQASKLESRCLQALKAINVPWLMQTNTEV